MGVNGRKIFSESFGSLMRQAKSRYHILKYKTFVPPSARMIVLCISRSRFNMLSIDQSFTLRPH